MKKSSKNFVVVLVIITIFMVLTVTSHADVDGTGYSGDFEYIVMGDICYISCYMGDSSDILIPAVIDGYAVNGIYSDFSSKNIVKNFFVENDNEFLTSVNGVLLSKDKKTLVRFPSGKVVSSYTIPSGVTRIDEYAFKGCSKIKNISIPNSVMYIGYYAFNDTAHYNNSNNWKDNVLYIDNCLISAIDIYGSYTIKNGTRVIADDAFLSSNLTNVTIPDSVITIGEYAFAWCGLTKVVIPDSVKSIGNNAFAYCNELVNITMSKKIIHLGSGVFHDTAFYNNSRNWLDGVLYIDKYLLDTIEDNVIGVCTVKNGTRIIASFAFYDCDRLTKVSIPNSVVVIGESTFVDCDNLKSLVIPASVSCIGDDSFVKSDFDSVYIPIKGYRGTCAETYANENGIEFTSLGSIPTSKIGLYKVGDTWCYVKDGKVNYDYTGLAKYNGKWYYIEDGVKDASFTGLVKRSGVWYYVKKGVVDFNYTGLAKHSGKWYYVNDGKVDFTYTGLIKHTDGKWYHVKAGVKSTFTGLFKYSGKWYYVKNGVVDKSYTGLVKHTDGKWYYVKDGVKTTYTGLCKYSGKWYYVNKGVVDKSYTGYVTYNGKKYKVVKGVKV